MLIDHGPWALSSGLLLTGPFYLEQAFYFESAGQCLCMKGNRNFSFSFETTIYL